MYSYVARQPIVDRNKKIIGYELLYRDGRENAFPKVDSDYATKSILIDQFIVHQSRILDGKMGFINFGLDSLLNRTPFDFPKETYTIEILESCPPSDELLDIVIELKSKGYRIALDDFVPSRKWRRFYKYVDIIKFDIQQCSITQAAECFAELSDYGIEFLAEKIETYQEFELAKKQGFDYFQGYFFSKPEIIQNKKIELSISDNIRLSQAVSYQTLDFKTIEDIVASNAGLSFKLLNFVNSCSTINTPIQTLQQALIYLGEERIRKFVTYAVVMSINSEKPNILFSMSLQRAKFLELIFAKSGHIQHMRQGYLCGMLSFLDAVLDVNMVELIEPLNLDDAIKEALISRKGPLGNAIQLAESIEMSDWEQIADLEKKFNLKKNKVMSCYVESNVWAAEASG